MIVDDEEVKFNLTKIVRFADDGKGTCMRVDILVPSIGDVLHDIVKRNSLEKCFTESLSMIDLEFEHGPLKISKALVL